MEEEKVMGEYVLEGSLEDGLEGMLVDDGLEDK